MELQDFEKPLLDKEPMDQPDQPTIAFLGKTGAGKTSLMNALARQ